MFCELDKNVSNILYQGVLNDTKHDCIILRYFGPIVSLQQKLSFIHIFIFEFLKFVENCKQKSSLCNKNERRSKYHDSDVSSLIIFLSLIYFPSCEGKRVSDRFCIFHHNSQPLHPRFCQPNEEKWKAKMIGLLILIGWLPIPRKNLEQRWKRNYEIDTVAKNVEKFRNTEIYLFIFPFQMPWLSSQL